MLKTMNRYQFISLEKNKKLRLIRIKGKILKQKLRKDYTSSIYELENFYIEIWKKKVRGEVVNIVTFKDLTLLNDSWGLVGKK